MATLDEIMVSLQAHAASITAIAARVSALNTELATLRTTLPPDVQTKIDAVATQAQANTASLGAIPVA